jgi:hypothetical protein
MRAEMLVMFTSSVRYCHILTKIGVYRQILAKFIFITFHENPSSGSTVVSMGTRQTS